MLQTKLFVAGHSAALRYATKAIQNEGICVSKEPGNSITHLLLPVPSFDDDGYIIGGGQLQELLNILPHSITVIGGHLNRPELTDYQTIDLLRDPNYTAENASITAYCAISLATSKLPIILKGQSILVIGWGRIGKCLTRLLKALDADVTIATRNDNDRAILAAMGYRTINTVCLDTAKYRIVFNTVPQLLVPQTEENCLKIDLASTLGLGGLDVIWARGLPGKMAPESSGNLIASIVVRYLCGKEQS